MSACSVFLCFLWQELAERGSMVREDNVVAKQALKSQREELHRP